MLLRSGGAASPSKFLFSTLLLLLIAMLIAVVTSMVTAMFGTSYLELLVGAILFGACIFLLLLRQQYEWIAGIAVFVGILIDWHQLIAIRFPIAATAVALVPAIVIMLVNLYSGTLVISTLTLLWGMLLILGALPILWAVNIPEAIIYYISVIFTPMLLFMIGNKIGSDIKRVRRLLSILAMIGTLIAIHTIITAITGTFLLASSNTNNYLASVNDFTLSATAHRVGSFFRNPDWNGTFLAMMAFIPIGLLASSSSWLSKLIYFIEILLILLALLYTYTAASWISLAIGLIPLSFLIGRGMRGFWITLLLYTIFAFIYKLFPDQSAALILHVQDPQDALLRVGAWETAIRVIVAYPLNGVGLGLSSYISRAEPYRVPLQYITLSHPHNSYFELGALAGLPFLIVFLVLLGDTILLTLKNLRRVDKKYRPLLGGALAAIIVFCINCLTINGWTLPPLANIAWLMLGAISSPGLRNLMSTSLSKSSNLTGIAEDQIDTEIRKGRTFIVNKKRKKTYEGHYGQCSDSY